jgi:proteic killer suppression protein
MQVELVTEELRYWYETPLEDIKGKLPFAKDILRQYKRKVDILVNIAMLNDLNQFAGLNFEKLKGKLQDFYSIRLNQQYRLLFKVTESTEGEVTVEVIQVTEISKHYE